MVIVNFQIIITVSPHPTPTPSHPQLFEKEMVRKKLNAWGNLESSCHRYLF